MPKIGTKTYGTYGVQADVVQYNGPAHTVSNKDLLGLKRTLPTISGANDRGVIKSASKLTRTLVINAETGQKRDAIVTIETSFPVGALDADIDAVMADAALLAGAAYVKGLAKSGDIHVADDAV